MYLTRTSYMTVAELEAAMRGANGGKSDEYFKKGDRVTIPGYLTEPIVEKPRPIPPGTEIRGIYLTGYTAGSAKGIDLIRRWRAAGGNERPRGWPRRSPGRSRIRAWARPRARARR